MITVLAIAGILAAVLFGRVFYALHVRRAASHAALIANQERRGDTTPDYGHTPDGRRIVAIERDMRGAPVAVHVETETE